MEMLIWGDKMICVTLRSAQEQEVTLDFAHLLTNVTFQEQAIRWKQGDTENSVFVQLPAASQATMQVCLR